MMNKKRSVRECSDDFYETYCLLQGDLKSVIEFLQEHQSQGWQKLEFDSDCGTFVFVRTREETNKEFDDRLKREKSRKAKEKEARRLQYEKLKEEFKN